MHYCVSALQSAQLSYIQVNPLRQTGQACAKSAVQMKDGSSARQQQWKKQGRGRRDDGLSRWERMWADLEGEWGTEGMPGCHSCRCCLWVFTQRCTPFAIHLKGWRPWPSGKELHSKIMMIKIKNITIFCCTPTVGCIINLIHLIRRKQLK